MTVSIATRKSWGARYADGDLTLTGLALEVFAHHSVTTQLSPTASIAAEQEQMRAIESVGQSRFGTGISYNVVVFPSGRAYQGVSWNRRGTHTGGRNSTVRSICFAGNYETNKPTAAQLATAATIYAEGKGKWWKTTAPLRGHRDVSQTACPGKNIYSQIPAIKAGRLSTPEDPMAETLTLDTTQARMLSEIHHIVTDEVIKDFDGLQTLVDALRRLLVLARRVTSAKIEAAVAKGIAAYAASTPGVDGAAITEGVLAEVRATLKAIEDTEYVLTPKEV